MFHISITIEFSNSIIYTDLTRHYHSISRGLWLTTI